MHRLAKFIILLLVAPIITGAETSGVDQALAAAQLQLETTYNAPADDIRIAVKRPDTRLTLKTCSHLPNTQINQPSTKFGKVTVKVHCEAPAEWSIYLPAEVHRRVKTLTSSRNIDRGAIITAADIEENFRWLTRPLAGAMQDEKIIIGMQARHTIQTGSVFKQRLLRRPQIVHKGHRFSVTVKEPGFTLATDVIALEDGADGDTIKVKNAKTEKLLWAKISRTGHVIIN